MAAQIHVGDVGTALKYQVLKEDGSEMDVSGATTVQITIIRPDKSKIVATALFVTNGKDGQIQYATQAGDLSLPGVYSAQVYVSWGTSPSWHSDKSTFQVWPNE